MTERSLTSSAAFLATLLFSGASAEKFYAYRRFYPELPSVECVADENYLDVNFAFDTAGFVDITMKAPQDRWFGISFPEEYYLIRRNETDWMKGYAIVYENDGSDQVNEYRLMSHTLSSTVASDYYELQSEQNLTNVQTSTADGFTTVTFRRLINSTDENDFDFREDLEYYYEECNPLLVSAAMSNGTGYSLLSEVHPQLEIPHWHQSAYLYLYNQEHENDGDHYLEFFIEEDLRPNADNPNSIVNATVVLDEGNNALNLSMFWHVDSTFWALALMDLPQDGQFVDLDEFDYHSEEYVITYGRLSGVMDLRRVQLDGYDTSTATSCYNIYSTQTANRVYVNDSGDELNPTYGEISYPLTQCPFHINPKEYATCKKMTRSLIIADGGGSYGIRCSNNAAQNHEISTVYQLPLYETPNPTQMPTSNPTANPTEDPTQNPTAVPTEYPTSNPTVLPTPNPTVSPTAPRLKYFGTSDTSLDVGMNMFIWDGVEDEVYFELWGPSEYVFAIGISNGSISDVTDTFDFFDKLNGKPAFQGYYPEKDTDPDNALWETVIEEDDSESGVERFVLNTSYPQNRERVQWSLVNDKAYVSFYRSTLITSDNSDFQLDFPFLIDPFSICFIIRESTSNPYRFTSPTEEDCSDIELTGNYQIRSEIELRNLPFMYNESDHILAKFVYDPFENIMELDVIMKEGWWFAFGGFKMKSDNCSDTQSRRTCTNLFLLGYDHTNTRYSSFMATTFISDGILTVQDDITDESDDVSIGTVGEETDLSGYSADYRRLTVTMTNVDIDALNSLVRPPDGSSPDFLADWMSTRLITAIWFASNITWTQIDKMIDEVSRNISEVYIDYRTNAPTQPPTASPTRAPSRAPSDAPTNFPSVPPTRATVAPTSSPSASPTGSPTAPPRVAETLPPTDYPIVSNTVDLGECPEGEPEPFGSEKISFSDIVVGFFIYCTTEKIEITLECNVDEYCGVVFGDAMIINDAVVYTTGKNEDLTAALYAYRLTERNRTGVNRDPDNDWTLVESSTENGRISMRYSQDLAKTDWTLETEQITYRVAIGSSLQLFQHRDRSEVLSSDLLTESQDDDDDDDGGGGSGVDDTVLIAGIAGVVAVIILAIALGYFCWSRSQKEANTSSNNAGNNGQNMTTFDMNEGDEVLSMSEAPTTATNVQMVGGLPAPQTSEEIAGQTS